MFRGWLHVLWFPQISHGFLGYFGLGQSRLLEAPKPIVAPRLSHQAIGMNLLGELMFVVVFCFDERTLLSHLKNVMKSLICGNKD